MIGALYADELTHYRARETRLGARAILLFALILGVSSLFGSIFILADVYEGEKGINGKLPDDKVRKKMQ